MDLAVLYVKLWQRQAKGKSKTCRYSGQFGQSAPYERLLAINGITVENIVELAKGEW